MKRSITTLLLICSLPAWPQGEALGRLFFTAEQRRLIDRQQRQGVMAHHDQRASYTLNGEIRRSSGKNTHWINGEAQTGATPQGIIGDTYHPATGERDHLLGDGRITIQRTPAKP